MKTIVIDIDDVLADHARAFADYSNEKFGMNIVPDDYQEEWRHVWKFDLDETIKRAEEYHQSDHLAFCATIGGAQDALKKLKERFRLIALTSRRNSISDLTREWIKQHYPDIFDDIIFAGFFDTITEQSITKTKGEIAKNIGADYIIDDQPKHVLSAVSLGMSGILFGNYGWNKIDTLPDTVLRANDWLEVLQYFESR